MKKTIMKMASVSLCVVLASSGVGMTTYALSADKSSNNTILTENSVQNAAVNTDESALVKNETVYVIAGAEGSVKKIIVSDWIKNVLGSNNISDKSLLTDVENVKGDESYTMSGDNMRVWDAAGNDIYYKGNIEKELPVDMSVTYKLDGKNISAGDLAGKSGKVTIRFDYKNNQYRMVSIDGKEEKIYVPFAMLTGIILNNDIFTNVSVSNGKIINDGDKTIVAGIAFPGLQDSLAISEEKLEIPDYVEISADVKNFSMTSTVTIATNEVFNKIDTESLDSIDELSEALEQMTGAMNELMNGSSKLYEGISTLLDKSGELIAGIDKLAAGAEQLKSGAAQVDGGASQLSAAANQVNEGASQLNTAAGQVNEGASQVSTGAEGVAAGASQLQTGAAALSEGLSSLSANNDTLNGGAKQVFETLLATAQGQLAASGLTVPQLTIENYSQVLEGIVAALNANGASEAANTVSSLKASLDSYNVFYKGLAAYTAGVAQANEGAAQLKDGTAQLNAGAAQLKEGTAQLSAGTAQLSGGAAQLSEGTTQLSVGALSLKEGTSQLYAGADELCSGILTLKNGAPALTDGIKQLQSGSMQLSDGLKEFNEKGIKKITDYVNGDIDELVTRVKAIGDVSKSYRSFSGISDDMDGEVKFIYRTDSVKNEN